MSFHILVTSLSFYISISEKPPFPDSEILERKRFDVEGQALLVLLSSSSSIQCPALLYFLHTFESI